MEIERAWQATVVVKGKFVLERWKERWNKKDREKEKVWICGFRRIKWNSTCNSITKYKRGNRRYAQLLLLHFAQLLIITWYLLQLLPRGKKENMSKNSNNSINKSYSKNCTTTNQRQYDGGEGDFCMKWQR